MHATAVQQSPTVPPVPAGVDVEVFYDGDCPLCRREIAMLRGKDRAGRIAFTDIAPPTFVAQDYGRTQDELMAQIHGRLPDGSWIIGVEVFRRLYTAIGWGGLVALTRWPLVKQSLDLAYRVFARQRLTLTGRRACAVQSDQPSACCSSNHAG